MMSASVRRDALLILVSCAMLATVIPSAARAQLAADPTRNGYANRANWLCLPGRADACHADLTTTIIRADGSVSTERFHADSAATIDCFYVYPTVSPGPDALSKRVAGAGERYAAKEQFARFASVCRTYAPLYRQFTLAAMMARLRGQPLALAGASPDLPYDDVRDAWNYYLQHWNHGRGVVLIGHSQGSALLTRLIEQEIDGKPIQQQLVSAILLGTNLAVRPDGLGEFRHIPLCRTADQLGCDITYDSFPANSPPPAASPLGHLEKPMAGMSAACVDPAELSGSSGELHGYFDAGAGMNSPAGGESRPEHWVAGRTVTTPFVSVPGLVSARCVSSPSSSYLAVLIREIPGSTRTSHIGGEVVMDGVIQKGFGLHLIDFNLAMGNLISIVGQEATAWKAARRSVATKRHRTDGRGAS